MNMRWWDFCLLGGLGGGDGEVVCPQGGVAPRVLAGAGPHPGHRGRVGRGRGQRQGGHGARGRQYLDGVAGECEHSSHEST